MFGKLINAALWLLRRLTGKRVNKPCMAVVNGEQNSMKSGITYKTKAVLTVGLLLFNPDNSYYRNTNSRACSQRN